MTRIEGSPLPQRLEEIDAALIAQLCEEKAPESQVLEFKRDLPHVRDAKARDELLKDVSALANASGGDLLYGIEEDSKGHAKGVAPITVEAADAAQRRLREILAAGLEPRILGLQMQEVPIEGGYVLIVRVPASFNGPHRFKRYNEYWVFSIRHGTSITDLSYPELRSAFDRTATLNERTRQFRAERLATIGSRRTSRAIMDGPQCVVHLIPLMAMGDRKLVDVQKFYHSDYTRFNYRDWHAVPSNRALNLDGFLFSVGITQSAPAFGYVQLFRSGAIESLHYAGPMGGDERIIWASSVCGHVRDSVEKLTAAARDSGIAGPAAFGVSLLGTHGYSLGLMGRYVMNSVSSPADRADLVLPEIWIERLEDTVDIDEVARPAIELVYQSFNVPRCEAYDKDGKWVERR
jgi:Putative DNA-binding domain